MSLYLNKKAEISAKPGLPVGNETNIDPEFILKCGTRDLNPEVLANTRT
jgi:hypothetical protein